MLLGFVGNSSNLISVDEAGHIFIWEYDLIYLKPSISFGPKYKYRIILDVPKYYPQGSCQYNFPKQLSATEPPAQLNPDKLTYEDRAAIGEYMQRVPLEPIMNAYIGVIDNKDGSFVY